MNERSKATKLWVVVGALLSVGLIVWWLSGRGEPAALPSTDESGMASQSAPSPSRGAEPAAPTGGAPSRSGARELEASSESLGVRREAEFERDAAGLSDLNEPSDGEIAALERDNDLFAEPSQDVLDEMYRDSQLLPSQEVLDELQRQSEIEPTDDQLDRLYRQAEAEPTPERLEELRRQSEIR
jgi:polyhydroxyalkanoate synthesis regulator phasin